MIILTKMNTLKKSFSFTKNFDFRGKLITLCFKTGRTLKLLKKFKKNENKKMYLKCSHLFAIK